MQGECDLEFMIASRLFKKIVGLSGKIALGYDGESFNEQNTLIFVFPRRQSNSLYDRVQK